MTNFDNNGRFNEISHLAELELVRMSDNPLEQSQNKINESHFCEHVRESVKIAVLSFESSTWLLVCILLKSARQKR